MEIILQSCPELNWDDWEMLCSHTDQLLDVCFHEKKCDLWGRGLSEAQAISEGAAGDFADGPPSSWATDLSLKGDLDVHHSGYCNPPQAGFSEAN